VVSILQTVDLCCERDDRVLVSGLNLDIEQGLIYQVEGPNGSGKTSLLRVLCGLSSRYTGSLTWRGQSVQQARSQFHAELLYLGHDSGVKAALSPRENLIWHAALKGLNGRSADEAIMAALEKVGLYGYEDSPCFALSAGQQRRVGLARLFLGCSRLWILDEPFTAIDKKGVAELEQWIEAYVQGGGTVILTTHHELTISQPVCRITLGDQ